MNSYSLEASRIAEVSKGKFSFDYYNHRPEVIEFFESKGYQGGGYTWELSQIWIAIVSSEAPLASRV